MTALKVVGLVSAALTAGALAVLARTRRLQRYDRTTFSFPPRVVWRHAVPERRGKGNAAPDVTAGETATTTTTLTEGSEWESLLQRALGDQA